MEKSYRMFQYTVAKEGGHSQYGVPEVGPDMEAEYGEGILGAGHSVHHPPLTRAAPAHGTSIPSHPEI